MRRFLGFSLLFVACFCPAWSVGAAAPTDRPSGPVYVLPVQGEITQAQFFFLRRGLKQAERAGASAVILDLDTYGGRLDATADIQKALLQVRVPTFAFVNPNAGSAGALISLATKTIYMAPVSAIGAAAPVGGNGEEINETMRQKTLSYFSNYARSVAERNGHNPDVAEAFMNRDKEVKIGDQVINPKGTLLTLNAQAATRRIGDKPVLAAGIADSVPDLARQAGLAGEIRRLEPTGFERLALTITVLAPLFLLGGLVGAYIEFKTPGAVLPGVVSAVCFALFFLGHYLAGLAGMETAAFFVLGVLLVIVEVIFIPGTTFVGGAGLLLMVGALVWAMVDRYPGQPVFANPGAFLWPLGSFLLAAAASLIIMAVLARYLPRTNLYHRLVLGAVSAPASAGALRGESSSAPGAVPVLSALAIGAAGVARTDLRPSGRAVFEENSEGGGTEHVVDVVSAGEFIPAGSPVRVRAVEGARVVVTRATASTMPTA